MTETAVKTPIPPTCPNIRQSINHFLCFFSLTLGLAGCTSELIQVDLSKNSVPPPGKATVFIIRPSYLSYGSRDLYISVNNSEIASLPRLSYTSFLMPPGKLELSGEGVFFSWPRRDITIDIKAGQTYYLKWQLKEQASSALMLYLFPSIEDLHWVSISKDEAQVLLNGIYYVEPTYQ
jgi:hypothetical protein